ncbi:MAG: VOC family protein [Victivallaceae bacterium]|nr:VOC family protein [Victivallaceae bacterium]
MKYMITLKVRDLDIERRFYRIALNYRDIVLDSSFAVAFQLDGDVVFLLEKCTAKYLDGNNGTLSMSFTRDDVAELDAKLSDNGFHPLEKADENGKWILRDPEGNRLMIRDASRG